MKLTISHNGIKRSIDGVFNICGSKQELLSLAEQIIEQAKRENFEYSWVKIVDESPAVLDTKPIGWGENV